MGETNGDLQRDVQILGKPVETCRWGDVTWKTLREPQRGYKFLKILQKPTEGGVDTWETYRDLWMGADTHNDWDANTCETH